MLFNSFIFLCFFVVFFFLFWGVFQKKLIYQNTLLVVASFVFYGWWDFRFLFLLVASALIDFFVGIKLQLIDDQRSRKILLFISIISNLGILGFFKYFNFFAQSLSDLLSTIGFSASSPMLNIVLPVGISFYTFQSMSYSIDIYRKRLLPTKSVIDYLAFISFFPQLVAGPIERGINLLPQMQKPKIFNREKAIEGFQQATWGFFKKIIIADTCAIFANDIFANYTEHNGLTLALGAFFFAFQIYGDFSGYSDIAIGIAKMLGIELMTNFHYPYFSRNIAEFWRKWHISLSTWFRDYLYFPLGGSRVSKAIAIRNIFIIFLVSGLWHGANWTFIIWGAIHATLYLPLFIFNRNKKYTSELDGNVNFNSLLNIINVLVTFILVTIAWIYFRSPDFFSANEYIYRMFSESWSIAYFTATNRKFLIVVMAISFILQMLLIEYFCIRRERLFPKMGVLSNALLIIQIVLMGSYKNPFDFIYFQF